MTPDIRGKLKKCGYRRTGEEVMTEEDAEGRLLKKVTRRKRMPPDTAVVMMRSSRPHGKAGPQPCQR